MKIELKKINEFRKELMGKHYKPIKKINFEILYFINTEGIIGLAVINIVNSLTKKALVIEDLIVDKKYRGQGYGAKLIKGIIQLAKKEKVDCIEVLTKDSNKIAQKLYKKFGFKDRRNISYRIWLK